MCIYVFVDVLLDLRLVRLYLVSKCPCVFGNFCVSILKCFDSCYGLLYYGVGHAFKLRLCCKGYCSGFAECLCLKLFFALHECECYLCTFRPFCHIRTISVLPCLGSLELFCLRLYCYGVGIKVEFTVVLSLHVELGLVWNTIMNCLDEN